MLSGGYAGWRNASCIGRASWRCFMSAVIAFGLNEFRKAPQGFIPQQDRGYLIVVAQLPPGASFAADRAGHEARRRDRAGHARRRPHHQYRRLFRRHLHQCSEFRRHLPRCSTSFKQRARIPRSRPPPSRARCSGNMPRSAKALILVVQPPPVQGIGNAGGFRMMVEDRADAGRRPCRAPSAR